MRFREPILVLLLMLVAAIVVFQLLQRQVAGAAFALGAPPEVLAALEDSLEDQKQLSRLDPENEASYRQRFRGVETTLRRLQILVRSRETLSRRYELLLLGLTGLTVLLVAGGYVLVQSREKARLAEVDRAITALAEGQTDLQVRVRGRDTAGRIASMIERTSRAMGRDRRRLAALRNLSAWQEASRRQAHEMRTPLTGLRLEIDRLGELLDEIPGEPDRQEDARRRIESARQELERLASFADGFAGLARLPAPRMDGHDLSSLASEFAETYRDAWPGTALEATGNAVAPACLDRDLIRQVLVNLCDNAARAGAERIRFVTRESESGVTLDVVDDGPGVAPGIRDRLFEPYVTTRAVGEGMGLGLAISKKILLDHGGDLELLQGARAATTFRLTLPPTAAVSGEGES